MQPQNQTRYPSVQSADKLSQHAQQKTLYIEAARAQSSGQAGKMETEEWLWESEEPITRRSADPVLQHFRKLGKA